MATQKLECYIIAYEDRRGFQWDQGRLRLISADII